MPAHPSAFVRARSFIKLSLLLLLLTLPAWAPLARPGLPPWQVGPLPAMKLAALAQSKPQPGIAAAAAGLDRGLEGPWPLLVGRLAGSASTTGIKLSAGAGLLAWALALAGWSRRLGGGKTAVLAALLAIYAPVSLNALYLSGAVGVLWAAAGFALAGWGIQSRSWIGLALIASGSLLTMLSAPGLGLFALAGLAILALVQRQWAGLALLGGGLLGGWALVGPLASTSLFAAAPGVSFYQLIEPGRLWGQQALSLGDKMDFSLGMPLLGLLAVALWLGLPAPQSPPPALRPPTTNLQPLIPLLLAALFILLSLEAVAARLPFLVQLLPAPWTLLLLAATLLALVAAQSLERAPELRKTPLWAALLLLPVLNAGPALAPTFIDAPLPPGPIHAFGSGDLLLLRLEAEAPPQPGATYVLQADWMAVQPPNFDYNVFVHVLDAAGNRVAQIDVQPQMGQRPMTTWLAGEVLADRYEIPIPASAPADSHVFIGLYNWQSLERLPVDGGEAVEVGWETGKPGD